MTNNLKTSPYKALISVYHKEGLAPVIEALVKAGFSYIPPEAALSTYKAWVPGPHL